MLVFAKAPLPGYAKTRLAAELGEAGAATLAGRLLERAVDHAVAAGIGPVELWCAPDCSHAAFAAMRRRFGVALRCQAGASLGERMAHALASALEHRGAALVVGTDVPRLDASYLRDAASRLESADVVVGPAVDGGYVLIGMKRRFDELFIDVAWSTPEVLAQTRQRIAALGLTHVEMPELADVDGPADLCHLPAEWRVGSPADASGLRAT